MVLKIDENRPQLRGFSKFYQRELAPWLDERIDRHKKAKTFALIIAGVAVVLFALLVWAYGAFEVELHEFSIELVIALVLGYWAGAFFLVTMKLRSLKDEVKDHLLTKVCGFMGLSYSLEPRDFPFDHFGEAGLFPNYHRKTLEDNIRGSHQGVRFDLLECRLERRQQTNRSTTYVEVYHGILFHFAFKKNFQGRTLISRDTGTIGNFFKGIGKEDRVRLEDPRFEKMFEVYSTDQVEARYLLTPTFMERVMELAELFGKKSIELAFIGDHLLVSCRVAADHFEGGGMLTRLDDKGRIETLVAELCTVYEVAETLQLNLKTMA